MIAPETLLKMHPLEAVRAQIQEQVRAPLRASYLKIDKPISLGGLRTQVFATLDKKLAPVELWDRAGGFIFEYDRIDLAGFVAGMDLRLQSQLPTDSSDLLRALLLPAQIPVVNGDVTEATWTALGVAEVLAADESYRWVGSVDMVIGAQAIEITGLVRNTVLTIPFNAGFMSSSVIGSLVFALNMTNTGLPTVISPTMVTYELPEQIGADHDGDNTRVTLTFNGFPYVGSLTLVYQRRSFPRSFNKSIKLSGPQRLTTKALAIQLSEAMKCTITADDIADEALPTQTVGSRKKAVVNFNKASLAYVGSIFIEYNRTV
jgi:hypothetical protein